MVPWLILGQKKKFQVINGLKNTVTLQRRGGKMIASDEIPFWKPDRCKKCGLPCKGTYCRTCFTTQPGHSGVFSRYKQHLKNKNDKGKKKIQMQ